MREDADDLDAEIAALESQIYELEWKEVYMVGEQEMKDLKC